MRDEETNRTARALQVEEAIPEPLPAPARPQYNWAPPKLKKFGGDMSSIPYTEMVQLSEMLAYNLHAVAGLTIGPHVLASALFKTVEELDALPGTKPGTSRDEHTTYIGKANAR